MGAGKDAGIIKDLPAKGNPFFFLGQGVGSGSDIHFLNELGVFLNELESAFCLAAHQFLDQHFGFLDVGGFVGRIRLGDHDAQE